MDDSGKWERYAALGGILFVVLLFAGMAVSGSSPKTSDSAAKILKYFHDNKDGIKVGAFLSLLASVPILCWGGSLWARLRRAEGGAPRLALVAVLGLVLGGAANLASQAVSATVALELKDVGATEAKFFFVLSQTLRSATTFGNAVLVLATSVVVLRTRVFPTWLAWVGVLDGIAFLVGGYSVATTSDGINTVGFAAFIVWAIWLIATSVIMFRAKEPVPAVP
jgi:Domain of unknown function (DUF4386)